MFTKDMLMYVDCAIFAILLAAGIFLKFVENKWDPRFLTRIVDIILSLAALTTAVYFGILYQFFPPK